MAQASGIQAVDSLSSNEFKVEIDGQEISGVFAVRGLRSRSVDVAQARLVNQPLTLTKMVQSDPNLPCNQWTRETLSSPTARITRELAVVAMDEGVETRRWVYKDAWISDISFSDFDSGTNVLIEEQWLVQHSGVEEIWPA
jgi:hypothetical protein